MKTIASLKGPECLRAFNKARHAVHAFLQETGVAEIRKHLPALPEIPEGATEEQITAVKAERERLLEEQSQKNLEDMLNAMLDDYPDATYRLLCSLIVPEPGDDPEPSGVDLIGAGLELITDPKVTAFFTRLARSALTHTGG